LKDTVIGTPGVAPKDLFDGIDTTLIGLAKYAGAQPPANLVIALQTISTSVDAAKQAVEARGPAAAAMPLIHGLAAVRGLRASLATGFQPDARYELDLRLALKESQFQEALLLTHGIRLEALADDGTVVVGQTVKVSTLAGNNGSPDVTLKSVSLAGFEASGANGSSSSSSTGAVCVPVNGAIQASSAVSCAPTLQVAKVPLSTPYWSPLPDKARYSFEPDVPFGLPFRPTPFRALFSLTVGGADVQVERNVEFRYSDLIAGEKRMELQVVPPFDVRMTPTIAIVPIAPVATEARKTRAEMGEQAEKDERGVRTAAARPVVRPRPRTVTVTVTNNLNGAVNATATIEAPGKWLVSPASAPVKFERADEEVTVSFKVTPDAAVGEGNYDLHAVVSTPEATSRTGYEVVEYPHIHRRHVIEDARTRVLALDARIAPGLRVGYVMGVGDEMPAAIQQLGADVHLIDAAELASSDLSRYNVIVTGVRAYERRADLRANNGRLLSYVQAGGVLLVNYNKQEFNQAQYGPYPVKVGQDRVTDETAEIDVLVPTHPVFNVPNKIYDEAWKGWVQERGTYFLAERDPRYVDLIRLADPFPLNPGVKTGALVEAKYGKGRWIYIGLGLWRQLPAGTEGAYELLANLLSLGKK